MNKTVKSLKVTYTPAPSFIIFFQNQIELV